MVNSRVASGVVIGVLALGALVGSAPSVAAGTTIGSCGMIRASVPYSHHGHRDRWRVYVTGHASCASAERVLSAVMHLDATEHLGSSDASSYFSDDGWKCPFGDMGFQTCVQPSHRPYRARALAIDCAIAAGGCPGRVPEKYFP
jgi:hypothetical protein